MHKDWKKINNFNGNLQYMYKHPAMCKDDNSWE